MNSESSRYMITAFDMNLGSNLIWSNLSKGLTKDEAINLYNNLTNYGDLINLTISKIISVRETTIYTFDNN